MIQSLVLSVCTLQSEAGTLRDNLKPITTPIISNLLGISGPVPSQRLDWPERVTKCFNYWVQNHYLKNRYSVFQEDLNSNQIHLGDKKKVCIRSYKPGTRLTFI